MVWIVIEENPWPDNYISVLVRRGFVKIFSPDSANLKVFENKASAIDYAHEVKERYQAIAVKLVYL